MSEQIRASDKMSALSVMTKVVAKMCIARSEKKNIDVTRPVLTFIQDH